MTGATAICKFFNEFAPELVENNIRLKVIGNVEELPIDLQQKQHADRQNPGMTGITGA